MHMCVVLALVHTQIGQLPGERESKKRFDTKEEERSKVTNWTFKL